MATWEETLARVGQGDFDVLFNPFNQDNPWSGNTIKDIGRGIGDAFRGPAPRNENLTPQQREFYFNEGRRNGLSDADIELRWNAIVSSPNPQSDYATDLDNLARVGSTNQAQTVTQQATNVTDEYRQKEDKAYQDWLASQGEKKARTEEDIARFTRLSSDPAAMHGDPAFSQWLTGVDNLARGYEKQANLDATNTAAARGGGFSGIALGKAIQARNAGANARIQERGRLQSMAFGGLQDARKYLGTIGDETYEGSQKHVNTGAGLAGASAGLGYQGLGVASDLAPSYSTGSANLTGNNQLNTGSTVGTTFDFGSWLSGLLNSTVGNVNQGVKQVASTVAPGSKF